MFNLTEATKKSSPDVVIWSEVLSREFVYLKTCLCSLPSLPLPCPSDLFVLQTDASGVGLGVVLSVHSEVEEELLVAFFSQKLKPRERHYSATELEGLAMVAAIQHFSPYLITHPFVETDHRALAFLNTTSHANGRPSRWALIMQPYSFTNRYRLGSQYVNADAFSRLVYVEEDSPHDLRSPEEGGDVMGSPTLPTLHIFITNHFTHMYISIWLLLSISLSRVVIFRPLFMLIHPNLYLVSIYKKKVLVRFLRHVLIYIRSY